MSNKAFIFKWVFSLFWGIAITVIIAPALVPDKNWFIQITSFQKPIFIASVCVVWAFLIFGFIFDIWKRTKGKNSKYIIKKSEREEKIYHELAAFKKYGHRSKNKLKEKLINDHNYPPEKLIGKNKKDLITELYNLENNF